MLPTGTNCTLTFKLECMATNTNGREAPAVASIDAIGELHRTDPEAARIAFEESVAGPLIDRLPQDAIDDAERWFAKMGAELGID